MPKMITAQDRQRMFTRRTVVFAGVKLAAISALVGRLYYLQFLRSDEYRTLAEGNRIKLQLLPPARGKLLDRRGQPMAFNEKNFRVFLEPEMNENDEETVRQVAKYIELKPEALEAVLAQVKAARIPLPIMIKEHLTWDEVSRVDFHTPDLPGVFIDVGQVRFYPLKEIAAHLIGYVGRVSDKEAVDSHPLMRLPDFKIGKDGVEKMLDEQLQGTAGVKHVEVNVHGLPVRELSTQESVPGKEIRLTIDSRLQQFTANRIGDESSSVVVMNIHNGNVLTLISLPAFDPNTFSLGITQGYWKSLMENKKHPLINKSIAGQYPPGSTFKMLVGLAALDAKAIGSSSTVYCPGHFFLGSHQFNCWKPEGHGSVNIHGAIAGSCDTFFYTMAQRIGIEKIAAMAHRLGIGDVTGIGLPGEKAGVMPDPDWKKGRYGQPWQGGDTINTGIGQGYVLATPLQLATMTARIANGKYAVVPRLYVPEDEKEPPKFKKLGIAPGHIEDIHIGMQNVTMTQGGTAYGKRILQPEYAMAGKTGTSQVRKILIRGQNQDRLPWEYRHHALFVGYAPIGKPKYAAAILVEHGGGGASAAAPIARDVLLKIQQLDDEDAGKKPATEEEEKP